MRTTRLLATGMLAGALALSLAGCGGGGQEASGGGDTSAPAASSPAATGETSTEPFGDGCAAVPKSGAGSFDGMAQDPVATAASNNPALSTLVTAVQKAGLVDTLNSAEALTVFAPTNDAFAKIPKKDLDAVLADKETLTKILTYHVVKGEKTPEQLGSGTELTTLQGQSVTPSGSDESYQVNDANVVCGNVQTANATVYLIDTVLMPPNM